VNNVSMDAHENNCPPVHDGFSLYVVILTTVYTVKKLNDKNLIKVIFFQMSTRILREDSN
jgi:hypothetical protein